MKQTREERRAASKRRAYRRAKGAREATRQIREGLS